MNRSLENRPAVGLLIQTQSLTKLYGVVLGVNDLTLDVPRGVLGLLGPNGAGKSTFMKLVMGQLRPSEGSIRVLGEVPWRNVRLYRRVGFCHEHDAFYDFLTGLEFVTVLARMNGMAPREARDRSAATLERVGEQVIDVGDAELFVIPPPNIQSLVVLLDEN